MDSELRIRCEKLLCKEYPEMFIYIGRHHPGYFPRMKELLND